MGKKQFNPSTLANKNILKPKIPSSNKEVVKNENLKKTRSFVFSKLVGKFIVFNEVEYYGQCVFAEILESKIVHIKFRKYNKDQYLIIKFNQALELSELDSTLIYIMNPETGEIFGFMRKFDDEETAKLFESLRDFVE